MKKIICLSVLVVICACQGNDSKSNRIPVAEAGENRTVSIEQLIELDGSGSVDPDGDGLTFEWSISQKPEGAEPVFADTDSPHPIFIAYEKGDYWFQLRVYDGKVWSEPDYVQITAEAGVFEPEAGITVVPDAPGINDNVYVSGATSTDPNNDPLNFFWDLVLSPLPVEFAPYLRGFFFTVNAPRDSLYRFALRVDDSKHSSDYAYAEIKVANTPPVVDAGEDVELNGSTPPYGTYLNASASDADGDALTYEWFIYRAPSGSNANISNPGVKDPLFTTDLPGFYVLRFRAYDGKEWSVPDYITLCKGTGCSAYLSESVTITNHSISLHPYFNATAGKYSANLLTSGLDIQFPEGLANTTERWVVLDCPPGTQITALDPNVPQSTTIIFEGDINMMNSFCLLRFESDTLNYQNNITYITSSSDTDTDLSVNFVNSSPEVFGEDIVFTMDPARVFQRIPLVISASDPDGDNLNYHWSIVSKPLNSQAFFSSDTNRPDPILYAGKDKDALGEYTIRVIVEDTLGGSAMRDIKLTVGE